MILKKKRRIIVPNNQFDIVYFFLGGMKGNLQVLPKLK